MTLTFETLTPKTIEILYWLRPIILWSLKNLGRMVLLLLSGNNIYISDPCDLDPLTQKTIGIHYSLRPIILWSLKTVGHMVLQLLSGNKVFYISDPCDLDLWRLDPKNYRDPLLTKTNHPMKFEDSGSNGSPVIEQKRYLHKWPLWPWPLMP